jgi:hypothetical protein
MRELDGVGASRSEPIHVERDTSRAAIQFDVHNDMGMEEEEEKKQFEPLVYGELGVSLSCYAVLSGACMH